MAETVNERETERPWEELVECVEASNAAGLSELLDSLSVDEQRFAMSRLSGEEQAGIVELLDPAAAAGLLEILPESQAVDILEEIPPEVAADIVEELPEGIGADFLREMHEAETEALLAQLDDPEEAEHLRARSAYAWDTAGGLMNESFASFSEEASVGDVLTDLGTKAEHYSDMDVQYVYVVSGAGVLKGVLRLRDLVLTPRDRSVVDIMIARPAMVNVGDNFETLRRIFEEKEYIGLPVVDGEGELVGVVTRQAVREATSDHQTEDYLHASGILGGEELRSMPMMARCGRRLAWLGPNIILNLLAASVIAAHENTLESVIALAVFLPIVSDMSGCSGNQAVAVSIRELTLGLIRPHEYLRIVWKEGMLGIFNGLVLGIVLGSMAAIWKGNFWLALVIGGALFLNTVVSVLIGGCVPLLLKKLKVDPALASGPILTTCTDMCGFFLVLSLASSFISKLS